MRRITILAAALAVSALLLAGCDLSMNIFSGLDTPSVPSASKMQDEAREDPEEFFDDVEDWMESGAADGREGDIITALDEIINSGGSTPEEVAEAQAYKAELTLKQNDDAVELTNNIFGAIDEITALQDGNATEDEVTRLFRSIMPGGVLDDRSAFGAMVDTLLESGNAYLGFAGSIGSFDDDGDGTLSSEELSFMDEGMLGDSVQRAVVSVAVKAALDVYDGSLDGNINDETAATDNLYQVVRDEGGDTTNFDSIDEAIDGNGSSYEDMANLTGIFDFSSMSG